MKILKIFIVAVAAIWALGFGAATAQDKGVVIPPYSDLVELVRGFEFEAVPGPGPLEAPTKATAARLAAWCAKYGLLGVLLQQVQTVTLAPRYGMEHHGLPIQDSYLRSGGGWVRSRRTGYRGRRSQPGGAKPGDLVTASAVPQDWPGPGAIIQDRQTGEWWTEALAATWARFFPDARQEPESHAYPMPLSEAFWRTYAEPVEDFHAAATELAAALTTVADAAPSDNGSKTNAIRVLNHLVAPVSSVLVRRNDHYELVQTVPTGLAAFAMMALTDIAEGRAPQSCAKCGKLFVTSAYQGAYCSDQCRRALQKRRRRARQRAGDPLKRPVRRLLVE